MYEVALADHDYPVDATRTKRASSHRLARGWCRDRCWEPATRCRKGCR